GGTDSGTDAGSGTGLDSGDGGATTGTSCTGATAIYYVAANGSDSNSGTSLSAAWQTLSKVNATSFAAGNCVLFRAGDTFEGPLTPKTSGTSSAPITFGAYGSGAKPTISGFTDVSAWTSVGTNQWLSTRAVSTLSTLNMVTVNGAFAPIGRWPNTG